MFLHSANEYKSFFFFSWLYKYKGFIINVVWVPVVGGVVYVEVLFRSSVIVIVLSSKHGLIPYMSPYIRKGNNFVLY